MGPLYPAQTETLFTECRHSRIRLTRAYYIGQYEVTYDEFARFVEETGYRTELEEAGTGGYSNFGGKWVRRPDHIWRTPGEWLPDPREPVVHITPRDAEAFCDWLTKVDGLQVLRYVLPTSAQWEFACRAGTSTRTYGTVDQPLADLAWTSELFGPLQAEPESHRPRPVGQKKPNAFGLYDMLGNVWEAATVAGSSQKDFWKVESSLPEHALTPDGRPLHGTPVYLRGGSWYRSGKAFARSGALTTITPKFGDAGIGFRIAISGELKPGSLLGNEFKP